MRYLGLNWQFTALANHRPVELFYLVSRVKAEPQALDPSETAARRLLGRDRRAAPGAARAGWSPRARRRELLILVCSYLAVKYF